MNKRRWCIALLCIFSVGCATRRAQPPSSLVLANLGVVAVIPFENYSSNANAGLIIQDQLANELMVSSGLTIMDPEKIRLALAPHAGDILTAKKKRPENGTAGR